MKSDNFVRFAVVTTKSLYRSRISERITVSVFIGNLPGVGEGTFVNNYGSTYNAIRLYYRKSIGRLVLQKNAARIGGTETVARSASVWSGRGQEYTTGVLQLTNLSVRHAPKTPPHSSSILTAGNLALYFLFLLGISLFGYCTIIVARDSVLQTTHGTNRLNASPTNNERVEKYGQIEEKKKKNKHTKIQRDERNAYWFRLRTQRERFGLRSQWKYLNKTSDGRIDWSVVIMYQTNVTIFLLSEVGHELLSAYTSLAPDPRKNYRRTAG